MSALAWDGPWPLWMLPASDESAYGPRLRALMPVSDAAGSEERSLVEAARTGDAAAVRRLLDRFSRPLYAAVILPRIGNTADAEEILRDTLMRAVERLSTFQWTGVGVYPWLRQIAIHLVIDHVRRNRRRTRLEDAVEQQVGDVLPLHRAGAEELLIEQQERAVARQLMESAMSELSERHRRAITLRVMEERSREDCAATLGVTVGNFDVILHRALAALKKVYGVR